MSTKASLSDKAQIELESIDKLPTQNQIFREYLGLVFKGLLASQQRKRASEEVKATDQNPDSISASLFHRFTSLPLIVSRQLFKVFSLNEAKKLDRSNFVSGFEKLLLGSTSEKLRLVFDLLNLEAKHSDTLKESDAKALVYHIYVNSGYKEVLKSKSYRSEKYHRIENSSEITYKNLESALQSLFANGTKPTKGGRSIDFKTFARYSTFIESDIVQMVLTFIYIQAPLLDRVRFYQKSFDLLERECQEGHHTPTRTTTTNASFLQLDLIGHVQHLRGFPSIQQVYQSTFKRQESLTPKQDGATDSLLTLLTFKSSSDKALPIYKDEDESVFVKRSRSHQALISNVSPITCSGLVYRFVKSKMIRPFWFELRGSDLYVFKTKKESKPKMIISLFSGFFLVDKQESELSIKSKDHTDQKLYSFELVFPNGFKKEFLFFSQQAHQEWYSALEKIRPNFNIQDHYEVTEACDISEEETFFRGFSVETGESLTITEIAKIKADASFEEQCGYEEELIERVEVLRACSHPLISSLKAVHETLDYLYIVQQEEESEPLVDYCQRQQPNPLEALNIIEQLTEILSFTKKMGVMVGNLTPPSFALCQPSWKKQISPVVKLVDLREARIMNPNSRIAARLEASLFSAPEIHSHKSLGFEVDAFSLGVILSCILFDCLPFQSTEQVIERDARIEAPCQSSGMPVILHNLVKKLLSKDVQKRTTIEGVQKVISLL